MATQFAVDLVFKSQGMGALGKMQQQLDKAKGSAINAQNGIVGFDRAAKGAAGSAQGAAVAAKGLGAAVSAALGPILGVTSALAAVGKALETAFGRDKAENRLKILTGSAEEYQAALAAASVASQRFGFTQTQAAESLGDVYGRLKGLGFGLKETNEIFTGFNVIARQAGVSAEDAAGAFIQLGQGLGSGALQGDELKSILERMPQLAQKLAVTMGEPVSRIRELGAEGAITSEIMYKALAEAAQGADELGNALTPTQQAMNKLGQVSENAFNALGEMLMPVVVPALEAASWALEQMSDWWEYLAQVMFPKVQEALKPITDALAEMFKDVDWEYIQRVVQEVLITSMEYALVAVRKVSEAIGWVIDRFRELSQNPVVQGLVNAIGSLIEKLGLAGDRVSDFKAEQEKVTNEAAKTVEKYSSLPEKVEKTADAAKELKKQQQEVTKAIQEAAKAADAQAAADKQALSFKFDLLNEELKTKGVLLKIDQERAQRALDAAKSEAEKIKAARQIYDLAIKQAKLDREIAQVAMDQAVQQAEVALKSAELKEREMAAVVALAEAQGVVTQEHYKALEAQQAAVGIANQALEQAYAITEQQGMQADALYKAQVEAAKAAYEQNRVWEATEGAATAASNFANNMSSAASEAERAATAMGNLSKNWEIGKGITQSGGVTLEGSDAAIQQALSQSKLGMFDKESGKYVFDWNRYQQSAALQGGSLSGSGMLQELQDAIKRLDEGMERRAQQSEDRLSRLDNQQGGRDIRVDVQTSGASVVRLNDDDYLRKDAAADMASRAATEAERNVLNRLQRSSSTRLSVGLR